MATAFFLLFDPAKEGESDDDAHKKWIEIESWEHDFSQPGVLDKRSATGGNVGRADHADLLVTKYIDASMDDILKSCWSGEVINSAKLECFRPEGTSGGETNKYLEIFMEKVLISHYSISAGPGGLPEETYRLSYGKVTYTYGTFDKVTGKAAGAQPVFHDLINNTIG